MKDEPARRCSRRISLAKQSWGACVAALALISPAPAATVYSSLLDIPIPVTFAGIYLDVDTGTTGTSEFSGWDINPFFGGVGIANSPAFQPARIGSGQLDRVLNLAPGTVVSGSLTYASGFGGSGNAGSEHLGFAGDQFQTGVDGYIGFRFTTNLNAGPLYGWMRLTLMNNSAGALIRDWAYEDSGTSITIGRVQQSVPAAGTQLFTLSPGSSESMTLGSAVTDTGGNVNSVVKTGSGTATLTAANTHTGITTVSGGTLELARAGGGAALGTTSTLTVSSTATLLVSQSNQVNDEASVTLSGGTVRRGSGVSETFGALNLAAASTIDFGSGVGGNFTFGVYESGATPGFKLSISSFSVGNTLAFGSDLTPYIAANSAGPYNGVHFAFDQGFTTSYDGTTFTITAIPEASTFSAALGALAFGLLNSARRKRRRPCTGPLPASSKAHSPPQNGRRWWSIRGT